MVEQPQDARKDDASADDQGVVGGVLKAMALSGVQQLINHSLAVSLIDMRAAQLRDGQVVLLTCQGKEVFNKVKINGQVQKYLQKKAQDFVTSLNTLRQKLPARRH
jgi:hypothetical protein